LSASVTRKATLAPRGRITTDVVDDEVGRLSAFWRITKDDGAADSLVEELLGNEAATRLDRFDAAQLAAVLHTCRQHQTASAAGRARFAHSRLEKKSSNDADRLVKYLARFDLRFEDTGSETGRWWSALAFWAPPIDRSSFRRQGLGLPYR
jgi:transcriptional regulatory protein RtcR